MSERKQTEFDNSKDWDGISNWTKILIGMDKVGDEITNVPRHFYTSLCGTRQRLSHVSDMKWSVKMQLGKTTVTIRRTK